MTVVNPKSISGINSITTGSGGDNLLTIHTSDASSTERVRINSSGDVIVGSGITVSPDGDIFATGVTTATTFVGNLTGDVTGTASQVTIANGSNDRVITAASANTLNGESNFTYDSSNVARLVKATVGAAKTTVPLILDNNAGGGDGTNPDVVAIGFAAQGTTKSSIRADVYGEGNLTFHNNDDTEKLRITSAGRVGINAISPDAKLEVRDGGSTGIIIRCTNTQSTHVNKAIRVRNNSDTDTFAVSHIGKVFPLDDIVMAAGKGINFDATGDGNGTDTSSVFDDYEEGTWTPNFTGSSSNPSFTWISGFPRGYYTKTGQMVTVNFDMAWSAATAGSGNLMLTGLPYSTIGNYYSGFGIVSHGTGLETASQGPRGIYSNAQVTFVFIVKNASSNVVISASTIQNNGHVFGGFTYRAHE